MTRHLWPLVVLASACGEDPTGHTSDGDPTDETASTGDTSTTADTSSTGDTSTTGDTAAPLVDCSALPATPLSVTQLEAPRGYHDVVFDPIGNLIGYDGNSLRAVAFDGTTSVFLTGTGTVQGMDWLADGDLVYADDDSATLMRVTPGGGSSVLTASTGGVRPYGVTVGPDGEVYTATWRTVERVSPATGQRTMILNDPAVAPYVVDFSPDHRTLYVGTIWNGGSLWALELDADLNATGPPTVFATVGGANEKLHDALAVDWCGNLYVAEFYTNDLYRITPAGDVTVLVNFTDVTYGHGIEWGSGIGGWRSDALYLPQPYNGNRVVEVVIGVPSREWTGTVWPP